MLENAVGPLELLVLQPTSLCNLNCQYCYLAPEQRRDRSKMSIEVVTETVKKVQKAGLIRKPFSIVWHAGEPLAAGFAFFEKAFAAIDVILGTTRYSHTIQTNATLINRKWCELFKKYNVQIGVSLDGPKNVHDANRLDWSRKGTFDRVLTGVELLREHGIPFYTISVVSPSSFHLGKEIYHFLRGLKPIIMGFSAEETEGVNLSALRPDEAEHSQALQGFWSDVFQEAMRFDEIQTIREFKNIHRGLKRLADDPEEGMAQGQMITPYRIISVALDGGFSTYSPELLSLKSDRFEDFIFGNVLTDDFLDVYHHNTRLREVSDEIARGVNRCRAECEFFNICKGGAPSNKLAETGRFDVTETMFCRNSRQTPLLAVLDQLETLMGISS